MTNWIYDPNDYEEKDYSPIPKGDYRVRIADVVAKTFKSGNDGYEMTLEVSGYNSRLWYYLVLNPSDPKKTNQRIGSFLDSFGITDHDLSHYRNWIGKVGAARVVHEDYEGTPQAKAAYFLSRSKQDKLPEWQGSGNAAAAPAAAYAPIPEDELPFS